MRWSTNTAQTTDAARGTSAASAWFKGRDLIGYQFTGLWGTPAYVLCLVGETPEFGGVCTVSPVACRTLRSSISCLGSRTGQASRHFEVSHAVPPPS